MRLLFASDFHGTHAFFEQFAALGKRLKPDVLLLGGDLFSNAAPVEDGPASQRRAAEGWFREWCEAAPAPVYWIAGNHEWRSVTDPPAGAGTYAGERVVPLGDWDLVGFSFCSPTPYWLLDHERPEESPNRHEPRFRCYASEAGVPAPVEDAEAWLAARPTLASLLRALPSPRDWRRTVFMAHNPPFDTGLDLRYGDRPVGSTDILQFILARKPAVSLHGHIHEAPLLTGSPMHLVGSTVGFNAGRARDRLRALSIDPEHPADFRLHAD
ncbi:MAG: metallophosphoesterase [Planctomycetia bacterium]|nr:metallophosphoesterase [Planctomycetia bacterium]